MSFSRRGFGRLALAAGATGALSGCGAIASTVETVETDVAKVSVAFETDVASLVKNYGIAKGIGQVALAALELVDPAAATIVKEGIALIDGLVSQGDSAVASAASTVTTTTNAILSAAASEITAVANS